MNIVKKARKSLKITQKKVAKKCKTKQSYISEIENFKRIPSKKILLKISKHLKLCPLLILQQCLCKDCKIKQECDIQIIIIKK